MDSLTKFKIKTFLYYLVIEPWTEKVSLPNFRSVIWVLIIVASFLRWTSLLLISVGIGIILNLIYEYRSGKFIYWYRKYQKKRYGFIKGNGGEDEKGNLPEVSPTQATD